MSDIFISYAKEDQAAAGKLASALESKGWSVWWDHQIPVGRTFDDIIEEALNRARCVIVLWSRRSAVSHWVRAEASVAAERGILVPALIETASIPLEFRRIQAADLTSWHGNAGDSEIRKLMETVQRLIGTSPDQRKGIPAGLPGHRSVAMPIMRSPAIALGLAFAAGALLMYLLLQAKDSPSPMQVPADPVPSRMNLLSQKNGGHLVSAPSDDWLKTNDDSEDWVQLSYSVGGEAVFAFRDERITTFDTFGMLIPNNEAANIKEFELLAGKESHDGYFQSIGRFQTKNVRLFPSAWQEFKFKPTRAKYMKIRLISTHGGLHPLAFEWELFGSF